MLVDCQWLKWSWKMNDDTSWLGMTITSHSAPKQPYVCETQCFKRNVHSASSLHDIRVCALQIPILRQAWQIYDIDVPEGTILHSVR